MEHIIIEEKSEKIKNKASLIYLFFKLFNSININIENKINTITKGIDITLYTSHLKKFWTGPQVGEMLRNEIQINCKNIKEILNLWLFLSLI